MLVCTLAVLHVDIWPLGLVGDIIRPLGSAKKPGVICQKIPEIDIPLASHLDPDTRDTAMSTCRRISWCRVFCLHPAPISLVLLPFLGSEEWHQSSCLPTWSWGLPSLSDPNLTRSWASRTVLWLASASLVLVSLGQPRLSTQTPVLR